MSGALGGIGGSVGDLLNFASNLKLGPWAWNLRQARYNGIPFAVRTSEIRRGRRVVVHEYPYRDDVWVEDLGRGTRVISFSGFLIGDDVFAQRDKFAAAMEKPGPGTLIHPSLGTLNVTPTEFSAGERADLGRVVELSMSFVQGAPSNATLSPLATALATISTAVQTASTIASEYVTGVTTAISGLESAVSFASNLFGTVKGLVTGFVSLATGASLDSGVTVSVVNGLQGNFGRYAGGANSVSQPPQATVDSVLAGLTTARAAAAQAGTTLGATVNPVLMPLNAGAVTEAVRAVVLDPAVQIRILLPLATYQPTIQYGAGQLGVTVALLAALTASLLRRSALVSLAAASAAYQPASYDDAIAALLAIVGAFDAEILVAADAGSTASYLSLRALRTAVADDLTTRAAALPRLRPYRTGVPMPSLALAFELYGDASRADQLVSLVDPVAPLCMPTSFLALDT